MLASYPNSSIPISKQANGVLVAPANTAMKPIAANSPIGRGTIPKRAFPRVAPIKNNGVTSPPLNPAERVKVVNNNLIFR